METFTRLKKPLKNPFYQAQKQKAVCGLTDDMIDMPIAALIKGFNGLPYCFSLQCCYGHFVYNDQQDIHNLDPLPAGGIIATAEYRIAYIAFCIENNTAGQGLSEEFKKIPDIDPQTIQYGCAEWFWDRQVNSYILQVEPDRFKCQDTAILDFSEALYIERIRNAFFVRLNQLLDRLKN